MSGMAPSDRLTPVAEAVDQTVYYNAESETYHMWCDEREYEPVTTALPLAVSSIHGVDPAALEPLADSIDPDALNALVVDWCETTRQCAVDERTGSVSFCFSQCEITIYDDGEIVIYPDRATLVS
ncbi:HalOD1 output domain-containing protein [Natrialba sp. PRR66]|uniref:HalOD1 output domain-containing protein n=1 Tax=Natrialba sp. PRR66 TaxID=3098146 RepID=UPI002B1D4593|nr:HalOD1 output domain-containing protein [Natrialba sp. PRR66]